MLYSPVVVGRQKFLCSCPRVCVISIWASPCGRHLGERKYRTDEAQEHNTAERVRGHHQRPPQDHPREKSVDRKRLEYIGFHVKPACLIRPWSWLKSLLHIDVWNSSTLTSCLLMACVLYMTTGYRSYRGQRSSRGRGEEEILCAPMSETFHWGARYCRFKTLQLVSGRGF